MMHYPEYYTHDQPDFNMVDSYMWSVSDDFDDNINRRNSALLISASLMVAQLCEYDASIENEDDYELYGKIKQILTETPPHLLSEEGDLTRPYMTHLIADLVMDRHQAELVDLRRSQIHHEAMLALEQNLPFLPPKYSSLTERSREALGAVNEYTALGLLTRLRHPRLLSLPALPHQDARHHLNAAANFDICLVESTLPTPTEDQGEPSESWTSEAILHKVQVKSTCFGECPTKSSPEQSTDPPRVQYKQARKREKERARQLRKQLGRYTNDITLVSGCCDLDQGANSPGGLGSTARALLQEFNGCISETAIGQLDNLSNSLLLTISSNTGRRGKLTPRISESSSESELLAYSSLRHRSGYDQSGAGLPPMSQDLADYVSQALANRHSQS